MIPVCALNSIPDLELGDACSFSALPWNCQRHPARRIYSSLVFESAYASRFASGYAFEADIVVLAVGECFMAAV